MMAARFFSPVARRVAGNAFSRSYLTRRPLPIPPNFQKCDELSEITSDKVTSAEKINELRGLSQTLEQGKAILVTTFFSGVQEPRLLTTTRVAEKAGISLARP